MIHHLLSVLIAIIICFGIYQYSIVYKKSNKLYGKLLFIIIIISWLVRINSFGVDNFKLTLPLHLCDITLIIGAYAIYKERFSLYNLLIFLSLGSVLAILFPALEVQGFKLFAIENIVFYVDHVSTFFILYTIYKQDNPKIIKGDWIRASLFALLSGLIMLLIINPLLDSNYYFVSEPLNNQIFLLFPAWPYYLIYFLILLFIITFLFEKVLLKIQNK